jgi:hypothetical protein
MRPAAPERPYFLITIDTEGDGMWWRPRAIETRNAAFLPRFQALCEKYELRPTYLTNYEMARSPVFRQLGLDVLKRDAGEIGMHLHAWHSPPDHPLTDDDQLHHPYLIEYPPAVMRAKIVRLTEVLENTFAVKMLSHRAGRWAFDGVYARLLLEQGYRVDCSVTPYVSWRAKAGDPRRSGGTDYSGFPDQAYFLDLDDIRRSGHSALLELPMTIVPTRPRLTSLLRRRSPSTPLATRLVRRLCPVRWLRPTGRNVGDLVRIVERAVAERRRYIQCMLHSSELMPGGSPAFPTADSVETLYDHLEQLFERAARFFRGGTLAEFAAGMRRGQPA